MRSGRVQRQGGALPGEHAGLEQLFILTAGVLQKKLEPSAGRSKHCEVCSGVSNCELLVNVSPGWIDPGLEGWREFALRGTAKELGGR